MSYEVSLAEMQGPLTELMQQCSGRERGRARFEEFKLWLKTVLLKLVTTVKVAAVPRFVARDAFSDTNPDGIKFYLWDGFKTHFLDKIEENVPNAELAIHALTRNSLDKPIMDELGDRTETTLAYLYQLIKAQAQGQDGPLLTNGYANIFYIRDAKGKFWAVRVHWDSLYREWSVSAYSVSLPDGWGAGSQVVSQVG